MNDYGQATLTEIRTIQCYISFHTTTIRLKLNGAASLSELVMTRYVIYITAVSQSDMAKSIPSIYIHSVFLCSEPIQKLHWNGSSSTSSYCTRSPGPTDSVRTDFMTQRCCLHFRSCTTRRSSCHRLLADLWIQPTASGHKYPHTFAGECNSSLLCLCLKN